MPNNPIGNNNPGLEELRRREQQRLQQQRAALQREEIQQVRERILADWAAIHPAPPVAINPDQRWQPAHFEMIMDDIAPEAQVPLPNMWLDDVRHPEIQPMPALRDEPGPFDDEDRFNEELRREQKVEPNNDGIMTVSKYFQLREFKSNVALFGVEVEVEGVGLPGEVKGFKAKADGSLRGESLEYVFNVPSNLQKSIDRIIELNKQFAEHGTVLNMSFRTSVHVHVNVSNYTKTQLCTFLYLAFLMEEPLVRFCGESRVGNRFCLRVKDAEAKVAELENLFGSKENRLAVKDAQHVKYSAINLASLRRFGTIEFRSMKGTTDVKVLGIWLTALNNIYNAAKLYENPRAVAEELRKIGGKELARQTLGNVFDELNYSSLNEDIHNSFSLLISLPYEFEMKDVK